MTRWYGIVQDSASSVFRSFDPSKFMVYFVDETDPEERTPEMLNAHAVRMRDTFHDNRHIVAVVKGGLKFLSHARVALDPQVFEAVVVTGRPEDLSKLNLKILDAHWVPGEERILMDEVMSSADPDAER